MKVGTFKRAKYGLAQLSDMKQCIRIYLSMVMYIWSIRWTHFPCLCWPVSLDRAAMPQGPRSQTITVVTNILWHNKCVPTAIYWCTAMICTISSHQSKSASWDCSSSVILDFMARTQITDLHVLAYKNMQCHNYERSVCVSYEKTDNTVKLLLLS